jgi:hypothetical protein
MATQKRGNGTVQKNTQRRNIGALKPEKPQLNNKIGE